MLAKIEKVVKEVEESTMTKEEKRFRKMQQAAIEAKKKRIHERLEKEIASKILPQELNRSANFTPENIEDKIPRDTLVSSCDEIEKKTLVFLDSNKTPVPPD